jgi:AcrR family transcriptional regulator
MLLTTAVVSWRMTKKRTRRRRSAAETPARRRYDSPLRRQQHADTRERIVAAGASIVHGLPTWDWRPLTFGAVGERADVSKRTVHRHFATERELRDAVLQRLVQESGIRLEGLELGNFSATVRKMMQYLTSFAIKPAIPVDPTFATIDQHRRDVLLGAVARATPDWSATERQMAAALLDMLWNPLLYERLLTTWQLEPRRAVRAVAWLVDLIEDALRQGRKPA